MWPETKLAVRKAMWTSQVIFSLSDKEQELLIKATSEVKNPTNEELKKIVLNKFDPIDENTLNLFIEEQRFKELKKRYSKAALSVGLTIEHGIAVLEYVALLKDVEDG